DSHPSPCVVFLSERVFIQSAERVIWLGLAPICVWIVVFTCRRVFFGCGGGCGGGGGRPKGRGWAPPRRAATPRGGGRRPGTPRQRQEERSSSADRAVRRGEALARGDLCTTPQRNARCMKHVLIVNETASQPHRRPREERATDHAAKRMPLTAAGQQQY